MKNLDRLFLAVLIGIVVLFLAPWAYHEWYVKAINHDVFWLTTSAGHFLKGWTIGTDIDDTNPPFSILLYAPAALLMTMTGLGIEQAAFLFALAALVLSALAFMAVLKLWHPVIDRRDRIFAGLSLCFVGSLMAVPHFGQRDQLLFLGLLPFMLMQLAITDQKIIPPFLCYSVLIAGSLLIMIKPHYGLVSALILLQRIAVTHRNWSVLKDPDAIILLAVTVLYVGFVAVFFPSYVHDVLPDAFGLYVLDGRETAWGLVAGLGIIIAVFIAIAARFISNGVHKNIILWLLVSALTSLAIFALMHRNYAYQLIPALSFLVLAAGQILFLILRRGMDTRIAMLEALILLGLLCVAMPHSYYPSRAQIKAMPLTQLVENSCKGACRFMLWSGSVRITQLTAQYSGKESGSRFPNLWFLPGIVHTDRLHRKYAAYMGEDLARFQPAIIVSCNEQGRDVEIFSIDPGFARQWHNYRKDGWVIVDGAVYETGHPIASWLPMSCDIYRRRT